MDAFESPDGVRDEQLISTPESSVIGVSGVNGLKWSKLGDLEIACPLDSQARGKLVVHFTSVKLLFRFTSRSSWSWCPWSHVCPLAESTSCARGSGDEDRGKLREGKSRASLTRRLEEQKEEEVKQGEGEEDGPTLGLSCVRVD